MSSGSMASRSARRSRGKASRRALLVLGMHRSGTSAVTRCLNLLGVGLGNRLLAPAQGNNSKGFWEHADVVTTHEELLGSLGRAWYDTRPLPRNWQTSKAALDAHDKLIEIVRSDFAGSQLWAVKDPRLCRFVPLWRKVLTEQGVDTSALLVVRHPGEVARSLKERNDLPDDVTYLSWLEHFAEAETGSRGLLRSVISYDGLLSDWESELTRVARDLRIGWPIPVTEAARAIDVFLDRGERHHEVTTTPVTMPAVLGRLYHLCSAFGSGAPNWTEISSLVDVYNLMAPAFLRVGEAQQQAPHIVERKSANMKRVMDDSLSDESTVTETKAAEPSATGGLDYAAVYYRSNEQGFAETRARHVPLEWKSTGTSTLRFEVPPHAGVLRFDPSSHSGAFNVRAMRLNGAFVKDLHGVIRSVNQYALNHHGDDGIWFASIDSDPWIELDVNGLIRNDEPLIIEIDCERHALGEVTGALMSAIADDMQRRIGVSIESVAQQLSDMQGPMQQHIDALQARGAELESRLAGERERAQHDQTTERELSRRLNAGIAWQTGKMLQLQQDIDKVEARHRAVMAALRTDYAKQHAFAESLRHELDEVHASTLWRALARLRGLLLLVPPGLRSTLRRAAKAAWWLMTPWRMPARLRFLKHRRQHGDVATRNAPTSAQADETDRRTTVEVSTYTYRAPSPEPTVIRDTLIHLSGSSLLSIVMPVYNTEPALLRRAIESVQEQWYPNWELILVDDHSRSAAVGEVLYGLIDPRISVIRLEENKRISGATNEGIQRAAGDYIVFLDHDDELTPDCLYELALCIRREKPDYIYSDEDKLDVDGSFKEPFFKPDWSPDTMMSTMYTCHVSCVRRSLALEVGGLRSEYDGSQDWDFVLRVTERTQRIAHIPKVLYHWRVTPASCASDLAVKPYASDASKRAREDALHRRGLSGDLVPVPELPGYFRTRYHLQGQPLISIVIPTKNNGKVLKTCIDSIFAMSTYRNFEVLVINNGSTDASTLDYLSTLRHREQINVLDHDVPFNYSEINNFGVRHAHGELLVFLNDDTEVVSPDWLEYMGGYAQLPHVGAVGAKLLYPGAEKIQHTGVINLSGGPTHAFWGAQSDEPGYFNRNLLEHDWVAVTGACLMLERRKFGSVGGFNEELAIAYNDVALCFSLVEHGYYQVVCPSVRLIHHESLSRGDDRLDPQKLARLSVERDLLYRRHPGFHRKDPFYNPNLVSDDVNFGFRQSR